MPRRQTIAFLLPSLLAGGAERSFLNLAVQISRESDFDVHLVLVNSAPEPRHKPPADLTVIDLGCSRVLASALAMSRYLKRHKPVTVFSALDHTNCMLLIASWISRVDTRIVLTLRNNIEHELIPKPGLRAKAILAMNKHAYHYADKIVAVSQGVADSFLRVTGADEKSVAVIMNPVLSESVLELASQSVVHPWFHDGAFPVLLAVGRLTKQKNYHLLTQAFAKVNAIKQARLIIVGEGEQRSALEHQIQLLGLGDRVDLVGHDDNPYKYMSKTDTFVLSSDYEGLPAVLIEALHCGARVVATDCNSGPREILDNGKYGILVPVGDADALAEAMLKSLDDTCPLITKFPYQKYQPMVTAEQYLELVTSSHSLGEC